MREEAEKIEPAVKMLPADKFELTFQNKINREVVFVLSILTKYLEEQGVKFYYNSKALIP
eukprot:UN21967